MSQILSVMYVRSSPCQEAHALFASEPQKDLAQLLRMHSSRVGLGQRASGDRTGGCSTPASLGRGTAIMRGSSAKKRITAAGAAVRAISFQNSKTRKRNTIDCCQLCTRYTLFDIEYHTSSSWMGKSTKRPGFSMSIGSGSRLPSISRRRMSDTSKHPLNSFSSPSAVWRGLVAGGKKAKPILGVGLQEARAEAKGHALLRIQSDGSKRPLRRG